MSKKAGEMKSESKADEKMTGSGNKKIWEALAGDKNAMPDDLPIEDEAIVGEDGFDSGVQGAAEALVEETNLPEQSSKELEGRLAELEELVAFSREKVLRSEAELANVLRRTRDEVEKARKFALEKFITELLPLLDAMDEGLKAMPEDQVNAAAREGMEIIQQQFTKVLSKAGVEDFYPEGEAFDPNFHEAMSMMPADKEHPANTVVKVVQRGYSLKGRLVRPAMVIVAK